MAASATALTAEVLINQLQLVPHPEGGFFRETYRSGAPPMESLGATDPRGFTITCTRPAEVTDPDGASKVAPPPPGSSGSNIVSSRIDPAIATRNTLTSIFFMLTADRPVQAFAHIESDTVHYWHGGGRAEYVMVTKAGTLERAVLGPRLMEGDVLQLPVNRNTYKAARLLHGEYVLLGEAVAPGFDYADHFLVHLEKVAARLGPELMAVIGTEVAALSAVAVAADTPATVRTES